MITYTPPPLADDLYNRFVDLALRYTNWAVSYSSDGEHLVFTADHTVHEARFSCRGLDTLAVLLAASDRHLRRAPAADRVRRYYRRWERRQAERERRELAALVDLATRLGSGAALETVAPIGAAA